MTERTIYTITPGPCLDLVLILPDDKLESGTMRVESTHLRPGGKGIDVSRAVKALGGKTVAIAALGSETGRSVLALVMQEGLEISEIPVSGQTRTNFIVKARSGDEYRMNTAVPAMAAHEVARFYERILETVEDDSFVTIGGSVPINFHHCWCERLVRILRESKRCRVALDTAVETTFSCLSYPHSRPDFIKPNFEEFHTLLRTAPGPLATDGLLPPGAKDEPKLKAMGTESYLEWLYTNPRENDKIAAHWTYLLKALETFYDAHERRVTPILSLGKEGALMMVEGQDGRPQIVHCYHKLPVHVVARVGAGDSLLGAFLLALSRRTPRDKALEFAVAAATVRVSMDEKAEQRQYIDRNLVDQKLLEGAVVTNVYQLPITDVVEPMFLQDRFSQFATLASKGA